MKSSESACVHKICQIVGDFFSKAAFKVQYILKYHMVFLKFFDQKKQMTTGTDKRTDESWYIFITWKINSGLVWAVGQYMKKKIGPIMSNF